MADKETNVIPLMPLLARATLLSSPGATATALGAEGPARDAIVASVAEQSQGGAGVFAPIEEAEGYSVQCDALSGAAALRQMRDVTVQGELLRLMGMRSSEDDYIVEDIILSPDTANFLIEQEAEIRRLEPELIQAESRKAALDDEQKAGAQISLLQSIFHGHVFGNRSNFKKVRALAEQQRLAAKRMSRVRKQLAKMGKGDLEGSMFEALARNSLKFNEFAEAIMEAMKYGEGVSLCKKEIGMHAMTVHYGQNSVDTEYHRVISYVGTIDLFGIVTLKKKACRASGGCQQGTNFALYVTSTGEAELKETAHARSKNTVPYQFEMELCDVPIPANFATPSAWTKRFVGKHAERKYSSTQHLEVRKWVLQTRNSKLVTKLSGDLFGRDAPAMLAARLRYAYARKAQDVMLAVFRSSLAGKVWRVESTGNIVVPCSFSQSDVLAALALDLEAFLESDVERRKERDENEKEEQERISTDHLVVLSEK